MANDALLEQVRYVSGLFKAVALPRWKRFDIGFDQGWVDCGDGKEVSAPKCFCDREAAWAVDDSVFEFYCAERSYDGGKYACGFSKTVLRGDL